MASRVTSAIGKVLRTIAQSTRRKPPPRRPRPGTKPPSGTTPSRPTGQPTVLVAPSRDSTLAGADIEYNPDLDGNADPGEVVWTWVPWEEDPTQGKDRPVVIIGRRADVLIGVPLTSKDHSGQDHGGKNDDAEQISVGAGSWDRSGRPSYAKLDRILEVDARQVRREGAILDRAAFDRLVAAIRRR